METQRDGFRVRSATSIITEPQRLLWWRTSLPSTLKETPYSGIIGLNTLKESRHRQFKSSLLIRFGPSEYENIDGQLAKIRQTSTIQEYQTRSAKGLCWHCDKPRSHDHQCKKGRLLLIEPADESEQEEDLKHKEENTEEDL
ncbi:hypothetical protein BHE74_00007597 [Ensete ventricosum]|nr:hypothetical protein BHE74_00007597 [Ensete ventricosum]